MVTPQATTEPDPILVVDGLTGGFGRTGESPQVLRDVSFQIPRGRLSAIVGETGSGKSITALSVIGLAPAGFTRTRGSIGFEGRDLAGLDDRQYQAIRGSRIAMVFQDARASLNPTFSIGYQLAATIRRHTGVSRSAARAAAEEALVGVRIPDVKRRMKQYPHQFSGGMAQRVALALALSCRPNLLLLDEPTTGLDATIQADVMDLIVELSERDGLSVCLITHDLGVVGQHCDHVVVMRSGRVVERADARDLFESPRHPYTRQLLAASELGGHA
ncbi:ABC transporter ATP-binding protein [Frankia sp. AgB32]|uniref:ABC transporter ATP-binding protein n=1 Tax=Frankia sp. AgB32 TaxID=631119 RepID=UPI00200C045F|nr:ABC transporter ATP-binding protein [Frankia sp. AgB32]MCK9897843.1 ABC transporter ATP-binding protein [Frankia sp. AgB32]